MVCSTTQATPLCASDVPWTIIQSHIVRNARFPACTTRVRSTPLIIVHSYQELCQPQMVRPLTLPAPTGKASEHTCQVYLTSRKRRSLRTRTDRSGNTHNNPMLNKMRQVPLQHHPRQIETHSHPLKGNNSISTHHPHQVATHIHLHHHHSSAYPSIIRS